MKKTNLLLSIATLVSLFTFNGCGNNDEKTSSSSSSVVGSININVKKVVHDFSVEAKTGKRLNNVSINIYNGNELLETVVTNFIGNAQIEILPGTYTVTLENLPTGYVAEESYELLVENKYGKTAFKCSSEVIDSEMPADKVYKSSDIIYNYTFTDTNEEERSFKSIFDDEGKDLIIITFWASWCGYCLHEFPFFNTLDKVYGDRVEVIGFNPDVPLQGHPTPDSDATILEYKEAYEISWTMALGNHFDYYSKYFPSGISLPLTVFVSKYGIIEYMQNGAFSTEDEVLDMAEKYLNNIG